MKSIPKFQVGNLCELVKAWDSYPVGTKIIIRDHGDCNPIWNYSFRVLEDGNSCAWVYENQLELIDVGGSHLFKEADANREKESKKNTDMKFIMEKMDHLLDDGGSIPTESVLHLFRLIGFQSRFFSTGEYYVLDDEWRQFLLTFMILKETSTWEKAKEYFTEEGLTRYKLENCWNAFHEVK